MAKQSNLLLTKNSKTMKHSKKNQNPETTTTKEGQMTLGMTDNGLKMLDFMCTEYVEMDSFTADCRVQAMRDGNVYITEKPKRVRNTPIFREDNCTFSLGQDDRYYFVFTMPKEQAKTLPRQLALQAIAIAQKVSRVILKRKSIVEA